MDYTTYLSLNKPAGTDGVDIEDINENFDLIDAMYPRWVLTTTANLTLYVDSVNGSDSNDGSQAHPLQTITAAKNKIPKVVYHTVTINLVAGSYPENLTVSGFVGSGKIIFQGGSSLEDSANYVVGWAYFSRNTCWVAVYGVRFNATGHHAFQSFVCSGIYLENVSCLGSDGSYAGFCFEHSMAQLVNYAVSNRAQGIIAVASLVHCEAGSGSGNTVVFYSYLGGHITYRGTVPSGTSHEFMDAGQVSRYPAVQVPGVTTQQRMQYGVESVTLASPGVTVSKAITFGTPFDAAPNVVAGLGSPSVGTAGYINIWVSMVSRTGFTLNCSSFVAQSIDAIWQAIGH